MLCFLMLLPSKYILMSEIQIHVIGQQNRGVITKSDLVDLIPVIGSCKLAVETLQAVCGGNGRLALRKAVQCGISVVADFYL